MGGWPNAYESYAITHTQVTYIDFSDLLWCLPTMEIKSYRSAFYSLLVHRQAHECANISLMLQSASVMNKHF